MSKFCLILPLAKPQAFGLALPDAGRTQCPTATLGEGKGEDGWQRPRERNRGGIMSIRDKRIGGPLCFGSASLGNIFRNIPEEARPPPSMPPGSRASATS